MIFFVILFCIYSLVTFLLPSVHDYSIYSAIWQNYLDTGHPYLTNGVFNGNAYSPLFIFLAHPYSVHPLLPRFIFVTCWFLVRWLVMQLQKEERYRKMVMIFILLNPALFIFFVVFGMNEIVMTLRLLGAILFLSGKEEKENQLAAGLILALGILFKFTLLVLVPFLLLKKNGFRWPFLLSCLGSVLVGFGAAYLVWGKEALSPFLFASGREATFFSIFYPLKHILPQSVISLGSIALLGGSLAGLWLLHLQKRFNAITVSLLALILLFMFYKVSLPQYQVSIIILSLVWIAQFKQVKNLAQFLPIYIHIVWIGVVVVLYLLLNRFYGDWEWIRNFISIPSFAISLSLALFLTRRRSAV